MKMRNGFVSNSSSSSFCLVGIVLESDELRKLIGKFKPEGNEEYEYSLSELIHEYVDSIDSKAEISIEIDHESDIYWIGHDIFEMKENETLAQFKDRTFNDIQTIFPKFKNKKKIDMFVEYIYN
jgi:hypothetical protein